MVRSAVSRDADGCCPPTWRFTISRQAIRCAVGSRRRELYPRPRVEQSLCETRPVFSFGVDYADVIRKTLQSLLIIHDRTHPRSAATAEGRRPHDLRLIDLTLTEICIADSSRIHPLLARLSPMTTKPPATASLGGHLGIGGHRAIQLFACRSEKAGARPRLKPSTKAAVKEQGL
jgi:hypothetical protein